MLNNYLRDRENGFSWHLGVSGHYYFTKAPQPKTFGFTATFAYNHLMTEQWIIQPNLGFGLMGSPFRTSFDIEVDGLFLTLGINFSRKF